MSAGDEAGTVRVAVADMARLLATVEHWRLQVTDLQTCNTRTLERARDAERQLASEREQHSRLREQWELMSAELARTRTDRQRAAFERDKALAKLEEGASDVVPPELARLWKAAQGARKKWDGATQHSKLAEECGEYVAEWCKDTDRYQRDHTMHELHDVLTVALSLAEPALMAASAERLEGRLP